MCVCVCVCLQVQERLKLFRRNSEGAGGSLAYQYRNCTRGQVNPRGVCVRGRGRKRGRGKGERKRGREESEGGREGERREGGRERGRRVREEERERGEGEGIFPYTYPLMQPNHPLTYASSLTYASPSLFPRFVRLCVFLS